MKKILIPIILILAACNDQLNQDPATSVDSKAAQKNLDLLVTGAYAIIGSGGPSGTEGGLYSTDLLLDADLLGSQGYMQWRGTFNQYNEISKKAMSTTNSSVGRIWRKAYLAINQANVILKHVENAPEGQRDYFKAQGLFIRGIMHFELVRLFGEPSSGRGVPIMLEPTEDFGEITYPSRASITDVYTQVIADLTEAKTLLEDNSGDLANQYVVAAFLARVYLQKGDYQNASDQATYVISSGNYDWTSTPEEPFNGTSSQTIFEIEQTTINNAGTANDGLTTFYACDTEVQGSASRGDVQILPAFIGTFEDGDARLELIYEGNCNKGSITTKKWHDPYANIPVVRLAEMYLIRAEADFRDDSGDPLADINAVRENAGLGDLDALTSADIFYERQHELSFEGHRIHDLRRFHDDPTIPETTGVLGDEYVFPIPQTEINTNPNLEQNNYYH